MVKVFRKEFMKAGVRNNKYPDMMIVYSIG